MRYHQSASFLLLAGTLLIKQVRPFPPPEQQEPDLQPRTLPPLGSNSGPEIEIRAQVEPVQKEPNEGEVHRDAEPTQSPSPQKTVSSKTAAAASEKTAASQSDAASRNSQVGPLVTAAGFWICAMLI